METFNIRVGYDLIPYKFTGVVTWPSGTKEWRINGKYHREDGPAIEWIDGSKEWFLNGKLVYSLLEPLGDYFIIAQGIPSNMKWLGKPITENKILTATGIMFIPDLPGILK
jgi:hypothetical protein